MVGALDRHVANIHQTRKRGWTEKCFRLTIIRFLSVRLIVHLVPLQISPPTVGFGNNAVIQ